MTEDELKKFKATVDATDIDKLVGTNKYTANTDIWKDPEVIKRLKKSLRDNY